jgi:hypothetical protein
MDEFICLLFLSKFLASPPVERDTDDTVVVVVDGSVVWFLFETRAVSNAIIPKPTPATGGRY